MSTPLTPSHPSRGRTYENHERIHENHEKIMEIMREFMEITRSQAPNINKVGFIPCRGIIYHESIHGIHKRIYGETPNVNSHCRPHPSLGFPGGKINAHAYSMLEGTLTLHCMWYHRTDQNCYTYTFCRLYPQHSLLSEPSTHMEFQQLPRLESLLSFSITTTNPPTLSKVNSHFQTTFSIS